MLLKFLSLAALASAAPLTLSELLERDGLSIDEVVKRSGYSVKPESSLDARQQPQPCIPVTSTTWTDADDTNPHQNFIFKQITPSVQCNGAPGNSATAGTALTVGWSFDLSVGGSGNPANGGPGSLISAGFSVSQSVTTSTSQTFGCSSPNGGAQTGSVCGFQRIQTTAYTVKEQECSEITVPFCSPQRSCRDTGNFGVVTAPNSDQGSGDGTPQCYYSNFQLGLGCVGEDHEYTSRPSSIPGGPQFVSCDDTRAAPGQ